MFFNPEPGRTERRWLLREAVEAAHGGGRCMLRIGDKYGVGRDGRVWWCSERYRREYGCL